MDQTYSPFEDQPGQCLVVDISCIKADILVALCASLRMVLRLNYVSDCGHPRIPFFALYAWTGTDFQPLFQYKKVNIDVDEAFLAVEQIKQLKTTHDTPECKDFKTLFETLSARVRDCMVSARRKPNAIMISSNELCWLCFADYLRLEPPNVFEHVKLVQISDVMKPCSFPEIPGCDLPISICNLNGHALSFDALFREWLTDKTVDNAALQLSLPSLPGQFIYCDIFEIMLPHEKIIFKERTSAKEHVKTLKACSRLPLSKFSHELLYGTPIKLVPTSCWKLEWDELASNLELFNHLCCSLLENKEVLFLERAKPFSADSDPFYAFIPGKTSAVLSPVIFNEIALPFANRREEQVAVSPSLVSKVCALPKLEYWNPCLNAPRNLSVEKLLEQIKK